MRMVYSIVEDIVRQRIEFEIRVGMHLPYRTTQGDTHGGRVSSRC